MNAEKNVLKAGGRRMTKGDWVHAITMLDNLDALSVPAKCRLCVYEECCDENTDCIDGIARYMVTNVEAVEAQ